jgi:hypothetical protein
VLNVIVTCTKEKRAAVHSDCELRSVHDDDLESRFQNWRGRLVGCKERVTARNLYGGDHWAFARQISSRRFDVQTYVCSAGYGLIHIDDSIAPYSATFSRRHPDTVWKNSPQSEISASDWWSKLCTWRGHHGFGPRSLTALAKANSQSPILVVASENYLRGIQQDLIRTKASLDSPELLMILSAGTQKLSGLTDNLLPCDARMQPEVGGILRSLNVRLANKIVSEARDVPTLLGLKRKLTRLLAKQPELPTYNRQVLTDNELKDFIRREIKKNHKASRTNLLRELRSAGYACEQKRFAGLFCEVTEMIDA